MPAGIVGPMTSTTKTLPCRILALVAELRRTFYLHIKKIHLPILPPFPGLPAGLRSLGQVLGVLRGKASHGVHLINNYTHRAAYWCLETAITGMAHSS